jgi:hypothetical protein
LYTEIKKSPGLQRSLAFIIVFVVSRRYYGDF